MQIENSDSFNVVKCKQDKSDAWTVTAAYVKLEGLSLERIPQTFISTNMNTLTQWRRSGVKSGGQGQSGQAIKLFQIISYVNDFQTFNSPGSWQPVGALKN